MWCRPATTASPTLTLPASPWWLSPTPSSASRAEALRWIGEISVATGKGISVFARDLKITPVSSDWTEFYVTRASGSIQILARKNDVTVNCGTNSSATVKQGQQISRDDSGDCGLLAKPGNGAATAAKGPAFDSRWVQIGGLGAGGALLGWVLLHGDNPVSPSGP